MADPSKTSRLGKLSISDNTDDDLFASVHSPSRASKSQSQAQPKTPSNPKPQPSTTQDAPEDAREAALTAELSTLQQMNGVLENLTASLSKAHSNMATISTTVTHATTLLDTWTRILSQTEHNQRLLLHPAWQGASQDIADAENEQATRAREMERRAAEEARRRQALEEKRRADEERRSAEAERAAAARTPRKTVGAGTRGRGRGAVGRGASAQTSQVAPERQASTGRAPVAGYGRVGSAGTRATATARGRGRGTG